MSKNTNRKSPNASTTTTSTNRAEPSSSDWIEQAFPQLHYLLGALDGEETARRWLEANSHGVALLTRALVGDRQAQSALENGHGDDLEDLFEISDNEDLMAWLRERRPELSTLFRASQGDEGARAELSSTQPGYSRLVPLLRRAHDRYLGRASADSLGNSTVAEMGCLIGELHLRQGEYEKAVEAFTRAIETRPAPDLFQGRARAYRLLAERDENAAVLLRQRG